jgi:hypothetical protein
MLDRRIIGASDGKIAGDDDGNENNNYHVYPHYYSLAFNSRVQPYSKTTHASSANLMTSPTSIIIIVSRK